MVLAKRVPQYARAFRQAFEVVNTLSGHVITLHDNGVDAKGNPVGGREGAISKFAMVDADGDPIFVFGDHGPKDKKGQPTYVFNGYPKVVTDFDDGTTPVAEDEAPLPPARVRLRNLGKTVNDPSRNPAFKTLGEKAVANRLAAEAEAQRRRDEARAGKATTIAMPEELAAVMRMAAQHVAAQEAKDATKSAAQVMR